ncbi:MAG: hypothetical protein WAW96_09120, partial [Alphaproteobacteria bacterium]
PSPLSVVASGFASIQQFEENMEHVFGTRSAEQTELVLDFSHATFLDLPTLQYAIALTLARLRKGLITKFRVPAGHDGAAARDFLRRWEFPKALRVATGIKFSSFVAQEDLRYFRHFGGDSGKRRYISSIARVESRDTARASQAEADTLLEPSSESSGLYVASRIVYEAMTNAVRHPGASVIQTSSLLRNYAAGGPNFFPFTSWKLDEYGEKGRVSDEASDKWSVEPVLSVLNRHLERKVGSGAESPHAEHFSVVFWDDGKSMTETLRAALAAGEPIREADYPANFDTDYRVRWIDEDGNEIERVVHSARTPDLNSADYELLLATLFPGVTCDVKGVGHRVHAELRRAEPSMARHGMGLFALIRTAVDEFDGAVAFRTGSFFMNVKRALRNDPTAHYRVKIQARKSSTPLFLGNMVTVRLPIRK